MDLHIHPALSFQKHYIGAERAPLLVIDNFVAEADWLRETASLCQFQPGGKYYPGLRTEAPASYTQLLLRRLMPMVALELDIPIKKAGLSMCHFSLVTLPPEKLEVWQRMPHIDSVDNTGLAAIHYLFKQDMGGTSFYRHRRTGFECINEERGKIYNSALEDERKSDLNFPGSGYINGSNHYFEQIASPDGVFNRMLIYKRNSLHSGSIADSFIPDANPLTGRLSINCFIDVA